MPNFWRTSRACALALDERASAGSFARAALAQAARIGFEALGGGARVLVDAEQVLQRLVAFAALASEG